MVLPVVHGRRGNPVIWARRFFGDLTNLQGDAGARQILAANADAVVELAVETDGAAIDIDTQEALERLRHQAKAT